jgi:hypothetical protein
MGFTEASLTAAGRLSRHNEERDAEHNRLWDEFRRRVTELAESDEFAPISVTITEAGY